MDLEKFRDYLKKRGVTYSSIANILGITCQAFSLKMHGKCKFKADELEILSNYLRMSDEEILTIFSLEVDESSY